MIRAFLSFLEARGVGDVPAAELRAALATDGEEAWAALMRAGVLRTGELATTHACDGVDCAREVRERPRDVDGGRRFLAVCTRSPRECETVHLDEKDLVRERIDLGAFVAVLRTTLHIEPPLDDTRGGAAKRAKGGANEPVLLGEQICDGVARDVFLARKPRAAALRVLLAERRSATRPTLVLIPTARGIDPDLLARYEAASVEIGVLTEWLSVGRGEIVATPRLRVVSRPVGDVANDAPRAPSPRRSSSVLDAFARAKRWGDVTFFLVDDETAIGLSIERRTRRVTAADLGMTSGRTRTPVRAFELLRRICDGNGHFDTRRWGSRDNGKQIVSELRRALSAAFEIPGSPIEPYSRAAKSWKPKFRALMMAPAEMKRLSGRSEGEG